MKRIIPARAGKTRFNSTHFNSLPDHPRSRGENHRSLFFFPVEYGSSPLARGKRHVHLVHTSNPRIIPARAGKTMIVMPYFGSLSDHPRSRGENEQVRADRAGNTGSSPLARGKHFNSLPLVHRCRIIPARAGKTLSIAPRSDVATDHPRSRGENQFLHRLSEGFDGSSPLARGKHVAHLDYGRATGIIPARAGKTLHDTGPIWPESDHPRSRGENSRHRQPPTFKPGSSPLARGKRLLTAPNGDLASVTDSVR